MDFGKRTRLTPTRAGLERYTYYVCYNCPAELSEEQVATHDCKGVA